MNDLKILKPLVIFEQLFESKLRLEDRQRLEFAQFQVFANVLTSCYGSALVKVGRTEVIAGLKVKVISEKGDSGQIVCDVGFGGLCNRSFHSNHSQPKECQQLTSILQRFIDKHICPDYKEQLNIYPENSVSHSGASASYCVKLHLVILQDDGCLMDACLPAALVCLASARWPKLYAVLKDGVESNFGSYRQSSNDEYVKLELQEFPIHLTFCCIPRPVEKSKLCVIAQPTKRELDLWDIDAGPISLTLNFKGDLLGLSLINGSYTGLWDALSETDLSGQCTTFWDILFDAALKRVVEAHKVVQQCINKAHGV